MAFPGFAYDFWLDFEACTVGQPVSTTELAASDHTALGSWAKIDTANRMDVRTAAEDPHTKTSDVGTKGMAVNLNSGLDAELDYTFDSNKTALSFGMWYKTCQPAAFTGGAFMVILSNLGFGNVMRLFDERDGGDNVRCFKLLSANDVRIVIADNTWYWVTVKFQQNAQGNFSVYDTSGNLVDTVTFTGSDSNIDTFKFGDMFAPTLAQFVYYDDLCIDWTTAAFPLQPFGVGDSVQVQGNWRLF